MKRKADGFGHRSLAPDAAIAVALAGLAFLAADERELVRFMALTGVDPADLRAMTGEPAFLAAVLAHLIYDEPLLLAFAANQGERPQTIVAAHETLAGPSYERDTA